MTQQRQVEAVKEYRLPARNETLRGRRVLWQRHSAFGPEMPRILGPGEDVDEMLTLQPPAQSRPATSGTATTAHSSTRGGRSVRSGAPRRGSATARPGTRGTVGSVESSLGETVDLEALNVAQKRQLARDAEAISLPPGQVAFRCRVHVVFGRPPQ